MQLGQLIRIVNGRWAGVFGGVAGASAAIVVQWQFSTLSTGRKALLVGLLSTVFFLVLVVLTNLAGLSPTNAHSDEAVGDD